MQAVSDYAAEKKSDFKVLDVTMAFYVHINAKPVRMLTCYNNIDDLKIMKSAYLLTTVTRNSFSFLNDFFLFASLIVSCTRLIVKMIVIKYDIPGVG